MHRKVSIISVIETPHEWIECKVQKIPLFMVFVDRFLKIEVSSPQLHSQICVMATSLNTLKDHTGLCSYHCNPLQTILNVVAFWKALNKGIIPRMQTVARTVASNVAESRLVELEIQDKIGSCLLGCMPIVYDLKMWGYGGNFLTIILMCLSKLIIQNKCYLCRSDLGPQIGIHARLPPWSTMRGDIHIQYMSFYLWLFSWPFNGMLPEL